MSDKDLSKSDDEHLDDLQTMLAMSLTSASIVSSNCDKVTTPDLFNEKFS